ncbi:MAG: hypothetical protein M3441_28750, partial [Chloroflexota bacterium]|nr:hypothetical protein [Chloroflexota bacterium]
MKAEVATQSAFDRWEQIKECGRGEPVPERLMEDKELPHGSADVGDIPVVKTLGWLDLVLVLIVKQV